LLGALFISGLINQPLARLSLAARTIAAGLKPLPLPEDGPVEIRDTNISFNQMARDLERIEADRTLILAGISHDLRTPIARMLLEVEMAKLSDEARSGMQSDLAQMESIIAQFLDYAKPPEQQYYAEFDLTSLLKNTANEASRRADIHITSDIAEGLITTGNPTEISRMLNNLIENARRYGKTPNHQYAELNLRSHITAGQILIELTDNGTGLPEDQFNYLLQPFTRLDAARSQASGAGLGLAIVSRIIQRHQGKLELSNHHPTGLAVKMWLSGRSLS
jgi:two-component system osmolarity sensor histidine kinase EnvZ